MFPPEFAFAGILAVSFRARSPAVRTEVMLADPVCKFATELLMDVRFPFRFPSCVLSSFSPRKNDEASWVTFPLMMSSRIMDVAQLTLTNDFGMF